MTIAPGPIVALSRSVAVAMVLDRRPVSPTSTQSRLASPPGNHRADAVRAHLMELSGDSEDARRLYSRAARRTLNLPEQRYLEGRARACR